MKTRFESLEAILTRHESLWRPAVFSNLSSARLQPYPELQAWLSTLTDADIEHLQVSDSALLASAQTHFADAEKILTLIDFAPSPADTEFELPRFWDTDVPGRKAEQIKTFTHALLPARQALTEWCCGKMHLGQLISQVTEQAVTGLEVNPRLVEQANRLIHKRKLTDRATVLEGDVLDQNIRALLRGNQHHIALHACGGLHISMLKHSIESSAERITLSPCCYHRFLEKSGYQALSTPGRQSGLGLSLDDLRLATRQSNTASNNETRKRKQLQAWRLGFDTLQRQVRGIDQYLPTPSLSVKVLHDGFEAFCHQLAEHKGIQLPEGTHFAHFESVGQQHFKLFERLELVRMLFRRALETWLILDRVLFLEESGYHCTVSEFCNSAVSPRNFLIDACKHDT